MKMRTLPLAAACIVALCAPLRSQTGSPSDTTAADTAAKPQQNSVTKLDGTKYFGFVEVTDDYTIRITNNSGITRLPIAQLQDADFQKYGFQKDRSKDGRFWYERKEALKPSGENPESDETAGPEGKSLVEIRLSEISAFQPLIAAYEKTLASGKNEKALTAKKPEESPDKSDVPFKPMFSEPGLGGPLPEPFSLSGLPVQPPTGVPAVPGGADIIQSATGATGLPSPP